MLGALSFNLTFRIGQGRIFFTPKKRDTLSTLNVSTFVAELISTACYLGFAKNGVVGGTRQVKTGATASISVAFQHFNSAPNRGACPGCHLTSPTSHPVKTLKTATPSKGLCLLFPAGTL